MIAPKYNLHKNQWYLRNVNFTKSQAEKEKEILKKKGKYVRIKHTKFGYEVWYHN